MHLHINHASLVSMTHPLHRCSASNVSGVARDCQRGRKLLQQGADMVMHGMLLMQEQREPGPAVVQDYLAAGVCACAGCLPRHARLGAELPPFPGQLAAFQLVYMLESALKHVSHARNLSTQCANPHRDCTHGHCLRRNLGGVLCSGECTCSCTMG